MKILQVLYAGLGGHGNVFFSIVKADTNNDFKYEALFNGVEEVRLEYKVECLNNDIPWNYIVKKPGLDINYYRQLYRYLRKSAADIFFLHSSAYILPAKLASLFTFKKAKIVVRETQANHLKSKMEWFWLVVALLCADKVVFLSQEYKEEVKKKLSLIFRERKTAVIPNGVDMDKFCPGKASDEEAVIVGMQSRLVKIKDHTSLIAAIALLKEKDPDISYKLKIAGDGDCMVQLKNQVEKLNVGDIVEFSGMLNQEELISFIQSLNIYVHASFGETMSTALMQAMCCKVPVIASNVKGINNMIRHNDTGLLVPVSNISELAFHIAHLSADKNLQRSLVNNAYQYAMLNFSNRQMFEKYKYLFISLSAKKIRKQAHN